MLNGARIGPGIAVEMPAGHWSGKPGAGPWSSRPPKTKLLLPEEHLDGSACELELFAQLVLYESFIWFAQVLRQVAKESEGRISDGQLGVS